MTDTDRESVERLRSRLVHQCNAALSMPTPLTGIAEISRQAEEMIAALLAKCEALEAKLAERVPVVKPLEFLERRNNQLEAGPYQVCCNGSPFDPDAMWRVRFHGKVVCKEIKRVDRAIEWANKHHSDRILSAITTTTITPAEEFVAKVQQHEWQHDEPNDRSDLPEDWLDYIEEMELFCNWVGMCAQKASALRAIAQEGGE